MSVDGSGDIGTSDDARIPPARHADVIVTEVGDEVLVYDKRVHHIHHLNAVSTVVWRHCDGRRTAAEIAVAVSAAQGATVDTEAVAIAVIELGRVDLLEGQVPPHRANRRRFMRRAAMVGAAAVPAIASVTAPVASAAASGGCVGETLDTCPNRDAGIGRCCINYQNGYVLGVCSETFECIPL